MVAGTSTYLSGRVTVHHGDSRDVLKSMADASVDSVVCDPPYALVSIVKRFGGKNAAPTKDGDVYARSSAGFMGQAWDTGETAFAAEFWAEVLRVLKPGGHILAFSGTRTYHRLACAIEDAGFEIRDMVGYLYGSGFPKSHNISKAIGVCECEANSERHLRSLRCPNVPEAEHVADERREILLARLPEQGPHGAVLREDAEERESGRQEPSMEGRGHLSQEARQLRERSLREMPARIHLNGEDGRLCDGASADHGEVDRSITVANGVRPSHRSQAAEQSAQQSGTLAGQPKPQARGAWEICDRCGKPLAPEGLGTALKPAQEPIVVARKPLIGTVAANVLEHGTGALNIDGCRVHADDAKGGEYTVKRLKPGATLNRTGGNWRPDEGIEFHGEMKPGRWPANVIHDGSEEVLAAFPDSGGQRGGITGNEPTANGFSGTVYGYGGKARRSIVEPRGDSGSAARFFYTAKADSEDRVGSKHPTVKPVDLMRYLCRLITPPGGMVLDPFAGTGTTGEAAWLEGFRATLVEREAQYIADIERRMKLCLAGPEEKARAIIKAKGKTEAPGPLFAEASP